MAGLSVLTSCIKYLLFVFNLLFVITGIIIISVGAAVQANYEAYLRVLDTPYTSVPALLIAIGVIIFIVAFFGCCGAIKENYCMTLTFSVLLIAVFILELSAGISGYVLRDRTSDMLTKSLIESMPTYTSDHTVYELWDEMQQDFGCCGVKSPKDWEAEKNIGNMSLPMSCCKIPRGQIGSFTCSNDMKENLYNSGCANKLIDYIKSHAASLGAAGICIAVVQFVGIIFACHLARRTKYELGG